MIPDPCCQRECWPVKVAFTLAAHARVLRRSPALPRGAGAVPGVLPVPLGIGCFCSNPAPLWPLLSPQHMLKMLEPASTL